MKRLASTPSALPVGFWLLAVGLGHGYLLWCLPPGLAAEAVVEVCLPVFTVPAVLHLLTEISYLAADAGAQADVEPNLIMGFGADAVNAEIAAHRGGWLS